MADYNQAAAPRDRSLDIARALAMFYIIVLWHLLGYTGAFSFVPYGGEYITSVFLGLFFVISGYLLAAKYRITGSTELKRFVSSRVLRIMPLYALSLATFAILSYCTVRTALLALTGLSTFIPPQPYTLWFVAMLLVFYLGFMVSGLRYCYAIWGGMYGLCLTATQFYDGIDPRLFLYFPCFIFGVFLQKRGRTSLITRGGVLLFCLTVAALLLFKTPHPAAQTFLTILLSISGAVTTLWLCSLLTRFKGIVAVAGFIAYSSMVAYLFHRQVMHLMIYIYWPDNATGRLVYVLLLCMPAVILFGYVGQKIYDLCLNAVFVRQHPRHKVSCGSEAGARP